MIEFFAGWGYEKLTNEYFVLYFVENGKQSSTKLTLRQMIGFLRVKQRNEGILACRNFDIVYRKYPHLKDYQEEVERALAPLIAYMFVKAVECEDFLISDYILRKFNLTEDNFQGKTIDAFKTINFRFRKSGIDYFDVVYVKGSQKIKKEVSYTVGEDFCRNDDKHRLFLTEQSKGQLMAQHGILEQTANDVLSCRDGYNVFEFGAKSLYIKKLDTDLYSVWEFEKSGDEIENILRSELKICDILPWFGYPHSNTLWLTKDIPNEIIEAVKVGSFPLLCYAKQIGDTYLEYELKFLAGIASDVEIEYLESAVKRDRFIARREVYDTSSVTVLDMSRIRPTFFNRSEKYWCRIAIDGYERDCFWYKDSKILIYMKYTAVTAICNISERLAAEFAEKAKTVTKYWR